MTTKSKAFEYKVLQDGILSNPYRRLRAGDTVKVKKEIKAAWLAPIIDGVQIETEKELPITPYINIKKPGKKKINVAKAPQSPAYERGMKEMERLENTADDRDGSLTDDQKLDKVIEAMGDLDPNSEKDYTKGGKPDANVLRDVLGFDVSAKMRDEAFEKFNSQNNGNETEGTGNMEVL